MVLPANFLPGTPDPLPAGVFLVPLCTDAESVKEMLYALDTGYKMSGKLKAIKDFVNALQYINNPQDAICWTDEPPVDPVVTVETDGDCQRVLINGVAVTGWICPPDPERPPPEPTVGTLGFTVSELEEMVMGCLNLTDSLRWVNGVLEYRTCDGWKPVPGLAGAVPSSASGNAGDLGVAAWELAGSPEIAPSVPVPHDKFEAYKTLDSLKCAKATAIVEEIWNVLTIGDAVDDANTITQVLQAIAGALGVFGWVITATTSLGIGLAQGIWAIVTGAGFEEYSDGMQTVINNTTKKQELICDLVPRMVSPVQLGNWQMMTITADDIAIALERFEAIVPHEDFVMDTLNIFPISGWRSVIASKVSSTECGCGDYLPAGYTPPPPVTEFGVTLEANGASLSTAAAPTSYGAGFFSPIGTIVGAGQLKYAVHQIVSDAVIMRAGMAIVFPSVATITKIILETTTDQTLTWGNTGSGFQMYRHATGNPGEAWLDVYNADGQGAIPGVGAPLVIDVGAGNQAMKALIFWANVREAVSGTPTPNIVTKITLTGEIDGEPFVEISPPF